MLNGLEKIALNTFSDDLAKTIDLGEAIDVVNKYIWELLNYSVAVYSVYNYQDSRFETRVYSKEAVSDKYIAQTKKIVDDFIIENASKMPVGAVSSITKKPAPLLFGIHTDVNNPAEVRSSFVIPVAIGSNFVGALCITSTQNFNFKPDDVDLVSLFLKIAGISIARIQSFLQSVNSSTESLIQSISNGVIMFDNQAKVTLANEAAMRYTGLPKEGYDLKELTKLFTNINLFATIEESLDKSQSIKIPRAQISQFWYEVAVLPVRNYNSEIIGGAIILHDITHVVEVDKAKTEFVSLASHQLRTPLSAIRWYTELLLDGTQGPLLEDQKKFLEVINESNLRMIELVGSLLNASRIELGTFAIDPKDIDLIEISKSLIVELEPYLKEKNLKVVERYDENLRKYFGDPGLLRIIFQNLLSNAVKYSLENNTVNFSIEEGTESNMILIKVHDEGLGIPKKQQGMVFTKLFRADNVKTSVPDGNGLGLYIVKSIVEEVGGKIWLESEEDHGTTFFVHIPKVGMKEKKGSKPLEVTKLR